MRRARRPAGLRFASERPAQSSHRATLGAAGAEKTVAAWHGFVLGAADFDLLSVLWKRAGGDVRELNDGRFVVLWPNGERLTTGDRDHIATQLRVRLARRDPLTLVSA